MSSSSGLIVEAPSSEEMASGSALLPFQVSGAFNNPADQVYIQTPATIVSGGVTSEPTVTVTITSLSGILTGGPSGDTGEGTGSITFSETADFLGRLSPSLFQGLSLVEPANVTSDQLVITVSDGVDPTVTRRMAISVLPVPDLTLPGTISVDTDEVTQLTGLDLTDPDTTELFLGVSTGEMAAPGLGIDVTPDGAYNSTGSISSAAILSALQYSDPVAGAATLDFAVKDLATGASTIEYVAIQAHGFAPTTTQPLLVGGVLTLGTSEAVGGTDGNGDAVVVDAGGTLELTGGVTLSAPAGLAVGDTGTGLLLTEATAGATSVAPQLAFVTLGIGIGAGGFGEADIGIGGLGAGSGAVIGQAGTGALFGEAGSSLGFGFGGTPDYDAIPYDFALAASAYGVAGGAAEADPLVLGAQPGAIGVLDTDGSLGVIGNVVVGQSGGQGALMLEGPSAITGTLGIGAASFARADQGLLPGSVSLAAGGMLFAEGNSVVPGEGNLYPQPTVLNTTVTGAGTLAIVPGAALDLGVGATISAATTIAFVPGVDTAGLATGINPAFDEGGDTGGELILNAGADIAGVIAGFSAGDVIAVLGGGIIGTSTSADATPGVTDLTVAYTTASGTADAVLRLLNPVASGYASVIVTVPYEHSGQAAGLTPVEAPPGFSGTPTANPETPASLRVVAGSTTRLQDLAVVDTDSYAVTGADTLTITVQSGTLTDPSTGSTWTASSPLVFTYFVAEGIETYLSDLDYTPGSGETSDSIGVTDVTSGGTFTATIPVTVSPAGQTFTWQGGVGGDFQAAGNWQVDGATADEAPTTGDTVEFGPGLALVDTSGSASSVDVTGTVEFEQALDLSGSAVPLTVAGGMAVFAPNSTFADASSVMVSSGVLEVDTQGATAGPVTVGNGSDAEGLLRVGPYGLLNIGPLTLGATVGSDGQAEIDGQLALSGSLVIGEFGSGSVVLTTDDNDIVTDAVTLGDQVDSSGALTLSGADLTAHQTMTVGNAGTGVLVESNGALSLGGALDIAAQGGSTGTMVVDGGTVSINSGYGFGESDPSLYVGGNAGGAGGSGTLDLGVGDGLGGVFTVYGSTDVLGQGTIDLDGGSLLSTFVTVSAGGEVLGNGEVFAAPNEALRTSISGAPLAQVQNDGMIAADGDLLVYADVTGSGTLAVGTGDTLEVQGSASGGTAAFTGSGGILILDQAEAFGDTIAGFVGGDTLDLPDIAFADVNGISPGAGDTVNLVTNTETLSFAVAPGTPTLTAQQDAAGGTQIVVACFRRGTRIETEHGPLPVEALTIGTLARVADGGLRPVVWLGHRRLDCRRHPRPCRALPVRVAAGAFGKGVPRRALFLSPDHAVFVDAALIPIRYLINDRSIAQVGVEHVEYWHVELDRHDVILAEGLPCESFLDTGNRGAFANGGGVIDLHPDFSRQIWEAEACCELVLAGEKLAAARQRLLARAAGNPVRRRRSHA